MANKDDNTTPQTPYELLEQYAAEMETVAAVAGMATDGEHPVCALYLAQRELERFCHQVGEVAHTLRQERAKDGKEPNSQEKRGLAERTPSQKSFIQAPSTEDKSSILNASHDSGRSRSASIIALLKPDTESFPAAQLRNLV